MSTDAVTPTCQTEEVSIIDVIAALHGCWTAIRTRHPEVPAAVIVVASGSRPDPTRR